MPTTCQNNASTQSWRSSHIQFDNGRNDGFVESGSGPVAMGYWQRQDQPFYYSMASVFLISDRQSHRHPERAARPQSGESSASLANARRLAVLSPRLRRHAHSRRIEDVKPIMSAWSKLSSE